MEKILIILYLGSEVFLLGLKDLELFEEIIVY